MVFFPPREIVAALITPGVTMDYAADIIEEHVLHRRAKGDSLIDVSNTMNQIEKRVPRAAPAVRQAQYLTNIPPPSELTVPPTPAGHPASASTTTLLRYLTSEPTPSIQRAREAILEYVLNREARIREKKPGRGGKGTLGREGFEEIATSLAEIEDGLRGTGTLAERGVVRDHFVPDDELDGARQLGLALVLSLRMLLSYFTLPDLARQILALPPSDAERTLVQHIRRRLAGEGRYAVARELEYVESLTLGRRPALRPAFRSARARTLLPTQVLYPIALPAPSKSSCIKLLTSFIKDIELGGPGAAIAYTGNGTNVPLGVERNGFGARKRSPRMSDTPLAPSPVTSPLRSMAQLPKDHNPIEAYTLELLSEYITREKREYMLKYRWAKSGREQLGKDLGDIEAAVCLAGRNTASKNAPTLLPIFLELRRTFALPVSPLPRAIVDPYYDVLPERPDPDSIPLREPTVSSITASLYVNPRLDDAAALNVIEELLESEREKGVNADVSEEKTISWLNGQIDQIAKRFPDGSYKTVFEHARHLAAHPRVTADADAQSAFPAKKREEEEPPRPDSRSLAHRRAKSTANPPTADDEFGPNGDMAPPRGLHRTHSRSASMPLRVSTGSGYSSRSSKQSSYDISSPSPVVAVASPRDEPPPLEASPTDNVEKIASDGDSDSIDSEFARKVAPFPQVTTPASPQSPLAPIRTEIPDTKPVLTLDFDSPTKTTDGGWWDVLTSPARLPSEHTSSPMKMPGSEPKQTVSEFGTPIKMLDFDQTNTISESPRDQTEPDELPMSDQSTYAPLTGAHLEALRKLDPSAVPPVTQTASAETTPSSPIDITAPGMLLNLGSTGRRSGASTPTSGTPITPTFSRSSGGLGHSAPRSPTLPTPTLDQLISEEDDLARGPPMFASVNRPKPAYAQHGKTMSQGSTMSQASVGSSQHGKTMSQGSNGPPSSMRMLNGSGAQDAYHATGPHRRTSSGAPHPNALPGVQSQTLPPRRGSGARPPPVPVMIDRPNFPSSSNNSPLPSPTVAATPRTSEATTPVSPDSQPQYGSYNSLLPASRPNPLNLDRMSASLGASSPLASPTVPVMPAAAAEQRHSKSRLGSFGRSVAKAVSGTAARDSHKPMEREYTYQKRDYQVVPPLQPKHPQPTQHNQYAQQPISPVHHQAISPAHHQPISPAHHQPAHHSQPSNHALPPQPKPLQPVQPAQRPLQLINPVPDANAPPMRNGRGSQVDNSPAKWNKAMVAGIMGPPAER